MSGRLRLISPPGYGPIVPLDRTRHAGMGLSSEAPYRWCAAIGAAYLSAAEFGRAALDYPIAFARAPQDGEFQPVAVLGLRSRQNLFVDDQGRWRGERYIPAYCRRYPFCIADIPGEDAVVGARRLVCVNETALIPDSPRPLFDRQGQPTRAWQAIQQRVEMLEGARMQTRVLARRLEALDLLCPFDALAVPRKGPGLRLQGLLRVDEERLQKLQARELRTLLRKGELRAIYAHLLSLENFARLLDLAAAHG